MLVVFGLEGFLHVFGEALTLGFAVGVVKEDVGLGTFATTVHMNEDGAAVFILLAVFTIKGIDFVATLLKALYLVQRDGRAHAGFTFTVREISLVTDAVFGILNDDTDFGTLLHQIAGKAKGDVVGIFVFVELVFANASDGARIGTAMSADNIEAGTGKAIGSDLDI